MTINEDKLTIHKNSIQEEPTTKEHHYVQECHWGPLSRTVDLPKEVDANRTRATLNDGVLTIVMPIADSQHTKIIQVK